MKQFFMTGLVISVMVVGLTSFAQADDDSDANFFNGFWKNVDLDDGSELKLQVADYDRDGVLDVTIGDDFFSSCLEEGEMGRGVIQGTGSINHEGNLVTSTTFKCFGTGRVIDDDQEFTWIPNKEKDFLTIESGPEGAWHRISTPPKSNDDDED